MFDDGTLVVEQCGVKIKAIPDNDCTHPAICIYINGELITRTEFDSDTGRARTIAYNNADDEPATITDYNKEGDI